MFNKKKIQITQEKKQAFFTKIKRVVASQLHIKEEAIPLTATISRDLGVDSDSLEAIELVMALEEEFNIEILDADAEKLKTIDDIVVYLAGRIDE